MKGTESLELLGDINEEYIASAEKAGRRNSAWRIALPIAAGLCLVLGVGLVIGKTIGKKPQAGNEIAAMTTEETVDPLTEKPDNTELAETPSPDDDGVIIPEEDRLYLTILSLGYSEAYHPDETPRIEWGIDYQMFIYNGKEYFLLCSLDALNDVMGEKLGTVELFDFQWTPNVAVDEVFQPSAEEAHPYISISENELKGTVEGPIFSVKTNNNDSFVCMRSSYRNMINIYTTDCGITEKNGAAFLEDVFHLSENITELRYYSRPEEYDQYAVDPEYDAVRLFIEAMDEAVWVKDTKSYFSRYFDEEAYMAVADQNPCRPVKILMKNRLDLNFGIYTDGIVTVGSSFHSMALRVDVEKIRPILDMIENNDAGVCVEKQNDDERLAECLNNRRFGEMIPTYVPEGLRVTDTHIGYIVDDDTGGIIGTDHIRIDYKDEDHDSIIYYRVLPIERMNTDYSIKCAVKKGARIVDIEDFDESCMYLEHSHSIGCEDEIYSLSVVTYKDAVIHIEGFDTQPEVIIALIRSIID